MPFRIHSLIRIIVLCEFGSGSLCGETVLKPFTGAEMVLHTGIFALIAAAMFAQKAGGETRP